MPSVRMKHALGYMSVYLLMVLVGRMAVLEGSNLALFWPAAGIGALWLLRGRNRAEVVFDTLLFWVSSLAIIIAVGIPPAGATVLALANASQSVAFRAVHARLRGLPFLGPQRARLASSRDLLTLVLASAATGVVGSVLGTVGSRMLSGAWSAEVTVSWIVRNGCGALVIGATALTVLHAHAEWRRRPAGVRDLLAPGERPGVVGELASVVVVTAVSVTLIFGEANVLPISFLLFAVSAWVGFRFSAVVGTLHSVALGTAAVMFTLAGTGVFGVVEGLAARAAVVQLFVAVTTAIVLMLAIGGAERLALLEQGRVAEAGATKQADLLHAVTSVMTDGLAVVDRDLRVLVSNPMAESIARLAGQGTVVRDPAEHGFYHADGTPVPPEELPSLLALHGKPVPERDYLYVDPDTGRRAVIAVSSVPLRLDGTAQDLAVVLLRDVTTDRARTRELEAFAGVAAHDLRNPLAAVQSWAMLLSDQLEELTSAADPARASLGRVLGSARRMQQLIDDLLAYAQARSAHLHPRRIDLDDLVDDVADGLRSHAHDGVVIEHGALGEVYADPTLTGQLFANVLGNAVKYVAPGTVPCVTVSSRQRDELPDMVEVLVSDNGIGIPSDERDRIFDSFHRAEHEHIYPGSGLGLAICERAVERHGGSISARPRDDGSGTIIVFTLPAVPGDDAGAADGAGQRDRRTTSAEPPPRREGSDTAVS